MFNVFFIISLWLLGFAKIQVYDAGSPLSESQPRSTTESLCQHTSAVLNIVAGFDIPVRFIPVFISFSVNVLTRRNLAHWERCIIILFIARNSQYATMAAREDDFVVLSLFESIQFWKQKQEGFYLLI